MNCKHALVDNGSDPKGIKCPNFGTIIQLCLAEGGSYAVIEYLINAGVDLALPNENGEIALHTFSFLEDMDVKMLELLLDKTPRDAINSMDKSGHTPLMIACKNRNSNFEIIKCLLEKGADPTATEEKYGMTALHMTCLNEEMALI